MSDKSLRDTHINLFLKLPCNLSILKEERLHMNPTLITYSGLWNAWHFNMDKSNAPRIYFKQSNKALRILIPESGSNPAGNCSLKLTAFQEEIAKAGLPLLALRLGRQSSSCWDSSQVNQ
jgi:hypothetical protein